jgi:hypothetical protein
MLTAASSLSSTGPPLWFFIIAGVLFFIIVFRIRQQAMKLKPVRKVASGELISFRVGVRVKPRLTGGFWSTKTLGAMQLTIGIEWVQLTTRPEIAGRLLGSEWFFSGPGTNIKKSKLPSDPLRRNWIILNGISGGRKAEVAVMPVEHPDEAWEALLRVGCQPF